MNLKIGDIFHGFSVERIRKSKSIGGTLYEMIHKESGAKLCWADNKEENKLFSVSFKTTPENSTGVFHILEHSVLCGSEKFPSKEPFLELLKSSMNTFLNAMTYPDKTVYPVSSRNTQDFLNLTEVYLDAVFAPKVLTNPNVFYQEGRRIEFDEEGNPHYNGVVFNEMKGAMANVDEKVEEGIKNLLFPDNCYGFNSGGDPAVIPDLTYEQYVATYRKYYSPSNAYFFLDGDIPLEETFAMIEEYLQADQASKSFTSANDTIEIKEQAPVNAEKTAYYEVEKLEENTDIIAFGKIVGTFDQVTKLIAVQTLCDYLNFSNESPLKAALLESELVEDVDLFVLDGIYQPFMTMILRNTKDEKIDEIKEIIRKVISSAVENGIDKADLIASLNKTQFGYRQFPEPQGLYRATGALSSWLFGADPLLYLELDKNFAELRNMAENGGFEPILEEMFLDQNGMVTLHMLPSETLNDEVCMAEQERVNSEVKAMSEEELEAHKKWLNSFDEWQQTPDSQDAIDAIPVLPLEQVSPIPKLFVTEELEQDGVKILYHPAATNGVVYLTLYIPVMDFSLEELSLLSLLPNLYMELPTEDHDSFTLQRLMKTYIGKFSIYLSTSSKNDTTVQCTPMLIAHMGFLKENLKEAQELLVEILTKTKFDYKDQIYKLVRQIDEDNKQSTVSSGLGLCATVVKSHYSAQAAVKEAVSGYTAMQTMHKLSDDFDTEYEKFMKLVSRLYAKSICSDNMIVGMTCEEPVGLGELINGLECKKDCCVDSVHSDLLSDGQACCDLAGRKRLSELPVAKYQTSLPKYLGIKIPAQTSYAVKGFHPELVGRDSDGGLRVTANIVSLSYLWNKVRVQGGAYGTGLSIAGKEGMFCYSYRDPSPANSIVAFDKVADFVRDFAESDETLDKYIISTVSSSDPLQTPNQEGLVADAFYFSGLNDEMRIKRRREMIETNKDTMKELIDLFETAAKDGAVCVVANENTLKQIDNLEIVDM